ncbi:MAG: zinc ribbon-containing protein [Gammaproteobacteria bacterium]|nr:zinc ribbon-containing protein [Gammaproteobacteria bacterium]MCB1861619.1 zinc ribbon-containing protein [Gammaproteobacteria bacterium]MCB1903521.1 zinc ribbon-containing protein [Gammaproteobacteria bacterium]
MTDDDKRDPIDRMTDAYEQMLERVDGMLELAEKSTLPTLRRALDKAREKAVELNELTREEAEKLAAYVERDMKDAAHYLIETGAEFSQWWQFDVEMIEQRMLEMFANVADKTRLELEQFADQAREASLYHTGELTGPGTLECNSCGKELHFHKAGHIPPCPGCSGTGFKRRSADDSA